MFALIDILIQAVSPLYAFPDDKRKLIKKKFHYTCAHRNQDCMGQLECCHINHNKNSSEYYSIDNAELLCTYHHWLDHLTRVNNGLTKEQNDWACDQIYARLMRLKGKKPA